MSSDKGYLHKATLKNTIAKFESEGYTIDKVLSSRAMPVLKRKNGNKTEFVRLELSCEMIQRDNGWFFNGSFKKTGVWFEKFEEVQEYEMCATSRIKRAAQKQAAMLKGD